MGFDNKASQENYIEVADCCKKGIGEIKQNRNAVNIIIQSSSAEKLKKFKELFDMVVITKQNSKQRKSSCLACKIDKQGA